MKLLSTLGLITGMTVAMTFLAATAYSAPDSAKGAGARALIARPASTIVAQAETKAMACPKCASEWTARADATAKGAIKPTLTTETHLCGGCDTKVAVTGQGKAARTVANHDCGMSQNCCK